jgi:hypothetical protein
MNKPAQPLETTPQKTPGSASLLAFAGVVCSALFMMGPALYSGFPLVYPDSCWYILAGKRVAAVVLLHHRSSYYGNRSFIYSLGILPLHWGSFLWPIIAFQSLLTSWILWLVFRSLVPGKPWTRFVIFIGLLSLCSSLSWFGSFAMPDILGPDLYLSIFLLVFMRATLSRVERMALCCAAWWAIGSHASHLLIAVAVCGALAVAALFQATLLRKHWRIAAQLALIIALSVGAQIAINTVLYGKPSLEGEPPPFLTARLIVDGPGRWYLEKNCSQSAWEVCRYQNNLSGSSDRFLWKPDGVWANASLSSQKLIRTQDKAFAKAVWRAYPREELLLCATNFVRQLMLFKIDGFALSHDVAVQMHATLPQAEGKYLESRQARNQLPIGLFNFIHYGAVIASLAGIAILLPWFRRTRPRQLIALSFVIAVCIVANALCTATLSTVDGRYESRVIWLVPFFALLCAFTQHAAKADE